jgi:hypothetical protein
VRLQISSLVKNSGFILRIRAITRHTFWLFLAWLVGIVQA